MLNWYRAALLSPSKFAVDPEASRVKVPALLIWGRTTSSRAKQWPEKVFITVMMDTLKCLRLQAHWVHHEEPTQVNTLLSQFFA